MKQKLIIPGILHGAQFTINYEIDRFINEVLLGFEYQECLNLINLNKEITMMDLGCNIGTFSLYVYDKCKQIYAVDLNQKCIDLFNETINDSSLNKITTYKQGIAGINGKVKLTTTSNETDGGLSIVNGNGEEIDVITLATFFKQNNIGYIDLLKVDVENAEHQIFESKDFLDIKNQIGAIIGEDHGANMGEFFKSIDFDYTLLSGRHFVAINKHDNDRPSNKEL